MASPDQCLEKAEECGRLTRYAETPLLRAALSNVERAWLKLADQCRRLEALIDVIESPALAPAMDSADCPDVDYSLMEEENNRALQRIDEQAAEVRRRLANASPKAMPFA
jgi:hypothetical protein